jgi:hypothetical protein
MLFVGSKEKHMQNRIPVDEELLNMIGFYLSKLDDAGIVFSDQEIEFRLLLDTLWESTAPDEDAMLQRSTLESLHDYFAQRSDTVDGDYGAPEPNLPARIAHDLGALLLIKDMSNDS